MDPCLNGCVSDKSSQSWRNRYLHLLVRRRGNSSHWKALATTEQNLKQSLLRQSLCWKLMRSSNSNCHILSNRCVLEALAKNKAPEKAQELCWLRTTNNVTLLWQEETEQLAKEGTQTQKQNKSILYKEKTTASVLSPSHRLNRTEHVVIVRLRSRHNSLLILHHFQEHFSYVGG